MCYISHTKILDGRAFKMLFKGLSNPLTLCLKPLLYIIHDFVRLVFCLWYLNVMERAFWIFYSYYHSSLRTYLWIKERSFHNSSYDWCFNFFYHPIYLLFNSSTRSLILSSSVLILCALAKHICFSHSDDSPIQITS